MTLDDGTSSCKMLFCTNNDLLALDKQSEAWHVSSPFSLQWYIWQEVEAWHWHFPCRSWSYQDASHKSVEQCHAWGMVQILTFGSCEHDCYPPTNLLRQRCWRRLHGETSSEGWEGCWKKYFWRCQILSRLQFDHMMFSSPVAESWSW